MAYTQISDVIVPSEFLPYVVERTAVVSRFFASGIIDVDPAFSSLSAGGGQTIQMPFWQDLSGSDQIISDTGTLTTKKIGAVSDSAIIHNRADAWSTHDLAKYLSGSDPMRVIGDLVADYWARKHEDQLIFMLQGVFAASNMTGNITDISTTVDDTVTTDNTLNGVNFINAKQLLGDAKKKLVAIAMHSAVEASLLKLDLIDFLPVTDAREQVAAFMGLEIIIDDNMPVAVVHNVLQYTTVLFGRGAIALGVSGQDDPIEGGFGTYQLEFSRVALAGQNVMINRRRFLLHPRGVKWTGSSMAGPSPTNAELAMAANWSRVYEQKNIRLIAIKHNVIL
jgi:hypothetical protein